MPARNSPFARFPRFVIGAAIVSAFGLGITVLVGWQLRISPLTTVVRGGASVKPNTAIALLFTGIALFLGLSGPARRARVAAAAASVLAALLGALSLAEYLLRRDFGIDQLLYRDPSLGPAPGRMAPNTAVCFVLLGVSLAARRRFRDVTQPLAALSGLITIIAAVGYGYGVESLYGIANYTAMALPTAVALLLLSAGVIFVRNDFGSCRVSQSDRLGSVMIRRLVPVAILLPILIGGLRLVGQMRFGLYDTRQGLALLVVVFVSLFCVLIWRTGVSLDTMDEGLRASRDSLEVRVKERTAQLESQTRTLNLILEGMTEAVIVCDVDRNFLVVNEAAKKWARGGRREIPRERWSEKFGFYHPDRKTLYSDEDLPLSRALAGESVNDIELYMLPAHASEGLWLSVNARPLKDSAGGVVGAVTVTRDITARKRAEDQLKEMSLVDELTGLYNRRGFLTISRDRMALAKRENRTFEIFIADLDGLKRINDTAGHAKGDEAIRLAAVALRRTFRSSDLLARVGGDEFFVLAEVKGAIVARTIRARLDVILQSLRPEETGGLPLSISLGSALLGADTDFDLAIQEADREMYRDKQGRPSRSTPVP